MTNVTMKAVDTLHISSVKADSLQPGEEFEVSGHIAEDLEKRGLAERVGEQAEQKADEVSENKMEAAPANKAAKAPKSK